MKEADNWSTLSTEIEEALDNGDLSLVSTKLLAIQNSLKILSHVQDYDARVSHSSKSSVTRLFEQKTSQIFLKIAQLK